MRTIPFSPPDISQAEIDAVTEVLRSGWITTGPKTKEFEKRIADYCGTSRAVCLNSATAGLECTLRILGIGAGDEVILPAYTYTATASSVCHVGATPVLCDCVSDGFEMDYEQLERLITDKTKAVMPVDIAGKICDYKRVFEAVHRKRSLFKPDNELQKSFGRAIVVADGAHCFGAEQNGCRAGNIADFTSFSFHAVKNLTTAEGGAVTWRSNDFIDNDELYRQYMLQSLHGQNKDALSKAKAGAWEYDIAAPLYKCNMTDITAAIGLAQLERYPQMLIKRKKLIELYDTQLDDERFIKLQHFGSDFSSSGHLYLLRISGISPEQRNELIVHMSENGVACNVHYKPLPMLTAYKNMGFDIANFPNAYKQFANEITLPLNTKMSEEDALYTAQTLKSALMQ